MTQVEKHIYLKSFICEI